MKHFLKIFAIGILVFCCMLTFTALVLGSTSAAAVFILAVIAWSIISFFLFSDDEN